MAVSVLGFMSFQGTSFYLAFFMQEVKQWDALTIAVHLLPQAIAGLLWNVLIGFVLHRVNNTLIMAAGSVCYVAAQVLLSTMKADSSYWAFIFPALILQVVGADFQFNVSVPSISDDCFRSNITSSCSLTFLIGRQRK